MHRWIKHIAVIAPWIILLLILSDTASADDWARGNIVGLCKGTEIRTGPGKRYRVHTIVPENDWAVKIIDGPRIADGEEWWDTSRKAAGDPSGGTGWVYRRQATSCKSSPPPQPQPTPKPAPARIVLTSELVLSNTQPRPGESVNASFRAKNVGGQTFRARYFGVKGRGPGDSVYDFFWMENFSLAAGQEFRYDANRTFDRIGSHWFTPNYSPDGSHWADITFADGRSSRVTIQVVQPQPPTSTPEPPTPVPQPTEPQVGRLQIIGGLNLSTTSPKVGERVTASFTVRNVGGSTVTIRRMVAGARGPNAHSRGWGAPNVDFPAVTNISLLPGWDYYYQQSATFSEPGDYFAEPAVLLAIGDWQGILPYPRVWFNVAPRDYPTTEAPPTAIPAPPPTMSEPPTPVPQPATSTSEPPAPMPGRLRVVKALVLSDTSPDIGESVTASFTLLNVGGQPVTIRRLVAGARGPNARSREWNAPNVDFPAITDLTLQPGEEYAYRQSNSFSQPGDYFAEPAMLDNNGNWTGIAPYSRVWFDVQPKPAPTMPVPRPTTPAPIPTATRPQATPRIRFPLGRDGSDPTRDGYMMWYGFGVHTGSGQQSGACFGHKPFSELIHAGEDWGGDGYASIAGHEVHAIADGVLVLDAFGWNPGYALLIYHESAGIWSLYGHLQGLRVSKQGSSVGAGDVIGHVLNQKGNSHLHFEIHTKEPITTRCIDDKPMSLPGGAGYVLEPGDLNSSGYVDPTKFILDQIGKTNLAHTLVHQTVGEVGQGENKNAGVVTVAQNQSGLRFAMRWPGSTLELQVIDPQGRQVDEYYNGARLTREATRMQLSVQQPMPGDWTMNVIGKEVSGIREPYEITVLKEDAQRESNATGWMIGLAFVLFAALSIGTVAVVISTQPPPRAAALYLVNGKHARLAAQLAQPTITIGRDPRSTLVILDPEVSRHHAQIVWQGNTFILYDLNSKNGTFVNGTRVQQQVIADDDRIRLGGTELLFRADATSARKVRATTAALTLADAYLSAKSGPRTGTRLALKHGVTALGRDRSCDIVLADAPVSRRHAEIREEAGGYSIYDLSTNGTFVNGERIAHQLLREGDEIQIGNSVLIFHRGN